MEKKGSARLTNDEVAHFFSEQLAAWPLAAQNYRSLAEVKTKRVTIDDFSIDVQFNPTRIISSGAKTDAKTIHERPCFLCAHRLPKEQYGRPFLEDYLLLVNPYPIYKEHFTVVARHHVKQAILPRIADLLALAEQLDRYTILYNGPTSGASAPDHHHFQVVTRHQMPIDDEASRLLEKRGSLLLQQSDGSLSLLTHYLRPLFVVRAQTEEVATALFLTLYRALQQSGDDEPAMNIIACKTDEEWRVIVIPRERHRPWQFDAPGSQRFISSPGCADMGGLFITVREEDYLRADEWLLKDIYSQVVLNNKKVDVVLKKILDR